MTASRVAPSQAALWWSGGKDAALALSRLVTTGEYEVAGLLCLLDSSRNATLVHDIPRDLIQAQADALGLPLLPVGLPGANLDGLAEALDHVVPALEQLGISTMAFGDLQHSGARPHREAMCAARGWKAIEPLWNDSPDQIEEALFASGIEAMTVVVDAAVLGSPLLGRSIDRVEQVIGTTDGPREFAFWRARLQSSGSPGSRSSGRGPA